MKFKIILSSRTSNPMAVIVLVKIGLTQNRCSRFRQEVSTLFSFLMFSNAWERILCCRLEGASTDIQAEVMQEHAPCGKLSKHIWKENQWKKHHDHARS